MNPKTYYESKIKALWIPLIVITVLFGGIIYNTYSNSGLIFTPYFFTVVTIFFLVFFGILRLYPKGVLELHQNHFIYKKGKFKLSALWSEVTHVSLQMNFGNDMRARSFFIVTTHGKTKLIDFVNLKSPGIEFNYKDFFDEIKRLSGKDLMIGDIRIGNYKSFLME